MSRLPPSKRVSSKTALDQTAFRPQLTSLIDVMTFLLLFLIKSFSVQGDVITPAKNLDLPVSASQTPPKPSLSIEITKNNVVADGKTVGTITQIMKSDTMLIPDLYRLLAQIYSGREISNLKGGILIQADRETEYSVLKRVMFSCSKAGLKDFTILAVQKE